MILFDADMSSKSRFLHFLELFGAISGQQTKLQIQYQKKLSTFQILTGQIASYSLLVNE